MRTTRGMGHPDTRMETAKQEIDMSAEAPPAVREGFCDLPEVPGVPNLASDAMLAIMAAVEPADVDSFSHGDRSFSHGHSQGAAGG